MLIPRFELSAIGGDTLQTGNAKLAATIYAFDVPLNPANPFTVAAGDGIDGARIAWNFQADPAGNSPKIIANNWHNRRWLMENHESPLAVCFRSFEHLADMVEACRSRSGIPEYRGASVRMVCNRRAAVLRALGHPLIGWQWSDVGASWHFPQEAAADAALLYDDRLYNKLPDAAISFAKGAILGHIMMIEQLRNVQGYRIEHRGRVAIIGKDMEQFKLDELEKILYRK
jgi:hypothetical protein